MHSACGSRADRDTWLPYYYTKTVELGKYDYVPPVSDGALIACDYHAHMFSKDEMLYLRNVL